MMSPLKIISICMLLFLISPTNAFQIIYEIQEGNFSKCGGEAKYLLKVQVFTEENGVLKPKVDSIKPCDPVYWGRVFDAKNSILEYYFTTIPESGRLILEVEFSSGDRKVLEYQLGNQNNQSKANLSENQIYTFLMFETNYLVFFAGFVLSIALFLLRRKKLAVIVFLATIIFATYPEIASFYGVCPEKYKMINGTCVYALNLSPKNVEYEYCLYGTKKKLQFTVYGGLKEYLEEQPRSFVCRPRCPSDEEIRLKFINQPEQMIEIKKLVEEIRKIAQIRDEQARIAISLVQLIPYDYKKLNGSELKERYPYEVLYDRAGICGEKSMLLAAILKELGFGVVLLEYKDENHMAVGIKCPKEYANYIYNNTGYCFVETTVPSIVTDSSGEYIGVGKLRSMPKIYFISDGYSFNSVSSEFHDAKEFQRLKDLAQKNNNLLPSEEYMKWKKIVEKYCILE
ncbi:MAG: hypothetical protein QXM06_03760 [Archaeoglobaceae archaeon]